MKKVFIYRLEIMLPHSSEIYMPGGNGVRSIYDDGDGISVIFDDNTFRFFNNAVPLKIDWKLK